MSLSTSVKEQVATLKVGHAANRSTDKASARRQNQIVAWHEKVHANGRHSEPTGKMVDSAYVSDNVWYEEKITELEEMNEELRTQVETLTKQVQRAEGDVRTVVFPNNSSQDADQLPNPPTDEVVKQLAKEIDVLIGLLKTYNEQKRYNNPPAESQAGLSDMGAAMAGMVGGLDPDSSGASLEDRKLRKAMERLDLRPPQPGASHAGVGAGLACATSENELVRAHIEQHLAGERVPEDAPAMAQGGLVGSGDASGAYEMSGVQLLPTRSNDTIGEFLARAKRGTFPRLIRDKHRSSVARYANLVSEELIEKLRDADPDTKAAHTGVTVLIPTVPLTGLEESNVGHLMLYGTFSPKTNTFGPATVRHTLDGHAMRVGLPLTRDKSVVRFGSPTAHIDFKILSERRHANGVVLFVEQRTAVSFKDVHTMGEIPDVHSAETDNEEHLSASEEEVVDLGDAPIPPSIAEEEQPASSEYGVIPVYGSFQEAGAKSAVVPAQEETPPVAAAGAKAEPDQESSAPSAIFARKLETTMAAAASQLAQASTDEESYAAVKPVHTLLGSTSRASIKGVSDETRTSLFAQVRNAFSSVSHDTPDTEEILKATHVKLFP